MKKTKFITGVMMFLIPFLAGAQALPFIAAESDAASLGKAGANIVETGSIAGAAFSNAAAIPFSESKIDIMGGYTLWQPSAAKSNILNVAGAYNIKEKFGVALGFKYGMNPAYDIIDATGIVNGSFTPSDMQIKAGAAYRLIPTLAVGVNIGYASSSLAEGHSYGAVAADIFLMSQFSDFKIAAGVANVLGSVKSVSGAKFSLPASIALGAGYDKEFGGKNAIEANLDVDYFFSGALAASVGAGYTFNDMVSFRAGYRYGGDSPIPSFASVGAGVKFAGVKLDLAYLVASGDSPMKNTLAIGLGYSF